MRALQSNLLADRAPFIGRGRECEALERALRAEERLVTITAPSGMGKTRLARHVATRLEQEFKGRGGVWFCDLSAARTAKAFLSTVGVVLGIPIGSGEIDTEARRLAHGLANRGPLLLILDDFESLVPEAASLVSAWLDEAPTLQILTTSLIPLGIEGEIRFQLGPLEPEDAVALYEDRAARAWADLSFTQPERETIGRLVDQLDRLPLAIELAAARVKILPPRALLARIADRFELLQGRGPGRHSSLEQAIAFSWELLDPSEQRALARSSVFVNGFTLDAAERVLAEEGSSSVHESIEGLREKSLLQLDPSFEPARFTLYESVRAFAARELDRLGEEEDTIHRHASYYVRTAEEWVSQSEGPDGPAVMKRLFAERENLIAIHRRCLEHEPALAARASLAANVAAALLGSPASETELLDSSVAAARSAGDPVLLARSLRVRAAAQRRNGRLDEARIDLDEALLLARQAGARALEGYIFSESGAVRSRTGEVEEARADLDRALELERMVGEPELGGFARLGLGILEESQGNFEASRQQLERALAIFRRSGNLRYQGLSLMNLGAVRGGEGRYEDARAVLEEALRVFRLAEDRASEADVILNLGSVALTAGQLELAERHLQEALVLERQLGNRRFEGLALVNLGLLAFEQDELRLAWQRLHEGITILRQGSEKRLAGIILPFFAAVEAVLGLLGEARTDFEEARRWFQEVGDEAGLAMTQILEGFLDLALGRAAAQDLRAEEAAALVERASQRRTLDLPAQARSSEGLIVARRLLDRALARNLDPAPLEAAAPPPALGLVVGPDAAWFELEGQRRVELGRRGALRRMLQGLVEQRLLAPGLGLSQERLSQIGWPGEQILPEAAANRVYTGVRALRTAGLGDALRRHADGYLLDPQLPVSKARA